MKYRKVGQSGLKVSSVSIGGWLTAGGSVDETLFHNILRKAIDGGINFIDVADIYARGAAETVLGKLLPEYKRSDLVLSSKTFWPMSDDVNDRGLSRKHIMESVEKSLTRLGTDYLDIYFCHRYDPDTPLEETHRAMDDLVRQGKILYWGTSCWSADQLQASYDFAEKRNLYEPIVEQPLYNPLARDIEKAVMPKAAELGMGLVVWSPLAGGLLTGKYNQGVPEQSRGATTNWLSSWLNDENLEKIRTFTTIAKELDVTPAQLALAWILARPEVSSVITGATRVSHIESNLVAANLELPEEVVSAISDLFPAEA